MTPVATVGGRDFGVPYRKAEDWHELVYHYYRVVTPGKDLPGEALTGELKTALRAILQEIRDDGSTCGTARMRTHPVRSSAVSCLSSGTGTGTT